MADRSIKILLSANVAGLVNGFKTAGTAAKNLNDRIVQNEAAVQSFTTGLGIVGAAGVAGAAVAIKTYASFDKTMSGVKATGAATAIELGKLRDAAIKAGADTAFSAGEAAAGIENLLKAGISAQDVLGGGLAGALDLAAAGELAVADAAEIAATAMTQFKLGGQDVTHIADLLAAGAGKANGDVTDMAAALKQGGLVAAQTGLSIEETTASLAAFASAGLLGSDAGTSLKTMLQRLSAPSGEAARLMDQLNISAYDAQGNFVGMEMFAGQLTSAMSEMTPATRNAALATIFGADAVRAAAVVYDQGESGIRKWITAVDDQGYAAEVAETRLDNLAGDIEAFRGSLESAFIQAGSGGNEALRGLVQGATDAVNAIGTLDEGILQTTTLIAGAGGLALLGTAGLGKLVVGINNAKGAMAALNISTKTAALTAGAVGAAVGVAALGLAVWAENAATASAQTDEYAGSLGTLGQVTDDTLRTLATRLSEDNSNWAQDFFGKNPGSIIDQADEIGVAIEDVQDAILGNEDAYNRVNAAAKAYADTNQSRVAGTMMSSTAYADRFSEAIADQSSRLTEAQKQRAQEALAVEASGAAQDDAADAYADATGLIEEQTSALAELIEAQQTAAGVVLDQRAAQRAFQESLDTAKESLKENGKTLDVTTEKGRANSEALDGIAESALTVAASMEANGKSQEEVQGVIGKSRKAFVNMATDMGLSKKEARALADNLGLIPGNYVAKISADTKDASDKIDKIRKQVLNLPDKKITVTTDTRVTGPGMTTGGLPWGDGEGAGWTGSTPRGVSQMSRAVQSMDPGARISSGYRPGAVTATGYPSYHGMGRAIDIVSPNMGRTFDMLARAFGSRAKELYYSPRGFIRNGRMTNDVADVTRRTHFSHVHLALANGGRLPGVAPANPGKDNLLGVDEHGMPLARIRSREWVVNQPASDYYGDGIMSALNSKQIPRELLEHLPGLASGGAVGSADRALNAAARRRDAAARKVRSARAAVSRARKSKSEKDDRAAEKRLEAAERLHDQRKAEVEKQRDRLANLREEKRDLGIDLRRGNIRESATSGLSGAYGVADEMTALARSGDLTKGQARSLSAQAGKAESAMRSLYKQAERLDGRLEKAKSKLEDIASIKASVGSALAGEQSLTAGIRQGQEGAFRDVTRTNSRGQSWTESIWDKGTKASVTARGLVSAAKTKAATLRSFASKLGKLRKLGLAPTVLEEIANAGSEEGTLLADAFLSDQGQIRGINSAYKDIAKHSSAAGTQVAEGFGLSAAQGLVKGLEKEQSKVEGQIEKWGVYMANGLIGALGGKKIKARANGGPVSAGAGYLVGEEGPELIVPSRNGYVMTADQTRRLSSTAHMVRRQSASTPSGPTVSVNVAKVVATDTQAAVDRMYTKAWDAINANNVMALAQGVGV